MEMRAIVARPLTEEGFAPFGRVLTPAGAPGAGAAADLGNAGKAGTTRVRLATVEARTLPLVAREIERHAHSSQTFIPLDAQRYLVVVAPPRTADAPDSEGLRAFIAEHGQCISYGRGVWHHGIVTLDGPACFAIVMHQHPDLVETEIVALDRPVRIVAPGP